MVAALVKVPITTNRFSYFSKLINRSLLKLVDSAKPAVFSIKFAAAYSILLNSIQSSK